MTNYQVLHQPRCKLQPVTRATPSRARARRYGADWRINSTSNEVKSPNGILNVPDQTQPIRDPCHHKGTFGRHRALSPQPLTSPQECEKVRTSVDLRVPVVFSPEQEECAGMSVRITVLLEEEVDAKFTAFCQDKGFKKSTLAARLIREHLAHEADPSAGNPSQKVSHESSGIAR